MKAKPYPLALLAQLREARTDEAARALAARIREREQAALLEEEARENKARAEREASATRRAEASALGDGGLRAADLQRAGAWEFGVQRAGEEAAHALATAEAKRLEAGRAEGDARTTVAARRADAEVVTADRTRWAQAGRLAAEKKDEDAAEDAWRPRSS